MNWIKRINIGISIAVLILCTFSWLLFGWSGTGWKAFAIPTKSMQPNIPVGSLVLVHRVPASSLKIGDVITYINPNHRTTTITHRIKSITQINGKTFRIITKGDSNKIADIAFNSDLLVGIVNRHVPHIGNILIDAKKPVYILPIIYFAALLIMIEEVQRLCEYYGRWVRYKLPGYKHELVATNSAVKQINIVYILIASTVLASIFFAGSAEALRSNKVILTHNKISTRLRHTGGGGTCTGNNSNNIQINTNTNQTAKTGNAHSIGSGNSTSGNASNSSSTSINVNVSNC
ncbi:MAG TPA: signal peptidase I [Candidatus Saccharimonadales bacterium]|nr:signal peptidase I [Candidatus Saccharimonadales bacterium]